MSGTRNGGRRGGRTGIRRRSRGKTTGKNTVLCKFSFVWSDFQLTGTDSRLPDGIKLFTSHSCTIRSVNSELLERIISKAIDELDESFKDRHTFRVIIQSFFHTGCNRDRFKDVIKHHHKLHTHFRRYSYRSSLSSQRRRAGDNASCKYYHRHHKRNDSLLEFL